MPPIFKKERKKNSREGFCSKEKMVTGIINCRIKGLRSPQQKNSTGPRPVEEEGVKLVT